MQTASGRIPLILGGVTAVPMTNGKQTDTRNVFHESTVIRGLESAGRDSDYVVVPQVIY